MRFKAFCVRNIWIVGDCSHQRGQGRGFKTCADGSRDSDAVNRSGALHSTGWVRTDVGWLPDKTGFLFFLAKDISIQYHPDPQHDHSLETERLYLCTPNCGA